MSGSAEAARDIAGRELFEFEEAKHATLNRCAPRPWTQLLPAVRERYCDAAEQVCESWFLALPPSAPDAKFVIWSEEHGAWWGPGRWGYTPKITEAGRYSAEEARAIVDNAQPGFELAFPVEAAYENANSDRSKPRSRVAPDTEPVLPPS